MLRLFTGIALPILLRQRLSLLGDSGNMSGIAGAKWVERDNLHLTLTFIGEINEAVAEDIDEALESIRAPRFSLKLQGTGSFATRGEPSTLWAGVANNPPLHHLKDKIDRSLQKYGFAFDKRKYAPHVTLARLKNVDAAKIAGFMQQHNLFSTEEFEIDEFTLFRSRLTKHGPAYEALKEYPLT